MSGEAWERGYRVLLVVHVLQHTHTYLLLRKLFPIHNFVAGCDQSSGVGAGAALPDAFQAPRECESLTELCTGSAFSQSGESGLLQTDEPSKYE